jgi:energy-coupling factor transporter transmembrane protein EcfT
MKNRNLTLKFFIFLFLIVLIIDYIFDSSDWGFIDAVYYNIFWATHFSLIASLIVFLILLKYKNMKKPLLIILSLFWILMFYGQFHQIDSYDYPHDVKVISKTHNVKIVVTESKSQKTDNIERDTIKVMDKFIFRKYLQLIRNPK